MKTTFFSLQFWLRLALAFLIPYFLFTAVTQQTALQIDEQLHQITQRIDLGVIGQQNMDSVLRHELSKIGNLVTLQDLPTGKEQLQADSIDVLLQFDNSRQMQFIYNSEINGTAIEKVVDVLQDYKQNLIGQSLDSLGIDRILLKPIEVEQTDLFDPMQAFNNLLQTVKSSLSNLLNILLLLLVLWLTRNTLLRYRKQPNKPKILVIGLTTWIATLLAMVAVIAGFYLGVHINQQGMIQGVITTIDGLLNWQKSYAFLLLWLPTWLLVTALLGIVIFSTKNVTAAYVRSFWVVLLILLGGFVGLLPWEAMPTVQLCLPIYNILKVGQMSLQNELVTMDWYIALGATTTIALLLWVVWALVAKPLEEKIEE